MITQGSPQHPVQLNDHFFGPKIKEVHWVGSIGVLVVDLPEGINLSFDPLFSALTNSKAVGDVVTKDDFAKYSNETGEHPSPISELVRPKIELSTLYGEGDKKWMVKRLMLSAGPDPGNHVNPSPFPPDMGLPENTFPNGSWQDYQRIYDDAKNKFMRDHPEGRWIEVSDLKSLGDDTLIGGDARTYFGAGEHWADLSYGEFALFHYELVPYTPPHYNIFGVQQYNTVLVDLDARAPGNVGHQPYGFNIFEAVKPSPWGVGEEEVAGNPGRKAVRKIYFFDFKVIEDQVISIAMTGNGLDDKLTDYSVKFTFQLFSQSTEFTLTSNLFTTNHPANFNGQKSFPYTQTGVLFKVDKKGFAT